MAKRVHGLVPRLLPVHTLPAPKGFRAPTRQSLGNTGGVKRGAENSL